MFRSALLDALALLLPTDCAACGAPDRALCDACGAQLVPTVTQLAIRRAHAPPLAVWSALPYRETVASALSKLKESGRTDVARPLALVLSAAVTEARQSALERLPVGAAVELALAPSSRAAYRQRGYNPVALLARPSRVGLPCLRPLRVARATRDQAGLGVTDRRANLDGSLLVRTRFAGGSLQGRNLVLVDDVVTTGATLFECRRALEHAGARVLGAATLAFAERRSGASSVEVITESSTQ
jgi:ComF family protein